MTVVLQVGKQTISAQEIVPLLTEYQMLPQLCRELLIDQEITGIACTPEEEKLAYQQFCERNQLTSEAAIQAWLQQQGISIEKLRYLAVRKLKVEKYKQATWGHQLESYFLKRKSQLDRVIYSLIRTQDAGIAQELYFRIQEGEESFVELAREYSQGAEAQTGGMIGPTEITTPHPKISQMLSSSQSGQLWPPTRVGDWFVIVRLEKFLPAQLDEAMQQRLLNELFRNWLKEQVQQTLDQSKEYQEDETKANQESHNTEEQLTDKEVEQQSPDSQSVVPSNR